MTAAKCLAAKQGENQSWAASLPLCSCRHPQPCQGFRTHTGVFSLPPAWVLRLSLCCSCQVTLILMQVLTSQSSTEMKMGGCCLSGQRDTVVFVHSWEQETASTIGVQTCFPPELPPKDLLGMKSVTEVPCSAAEL